MKTIIKGYAGIVNDKIDITQEYFNKDLKVYTIYPNLKTAKRIAKYEKVVRVEIKIK